MLQNVGAFMRQYKGFFGRTAARRCPHSDLTPIYGDPINHCGGWRLHCNQCCRYIDGEAEFAEMRKNEIEPPVTSREYELCECDHMRYDHVCGGCVARAVGAVCDCKDFVLATKCPRMRYPDGKHCGEDDWHAENCPERGDVH